MKVTLLRHTADPELLTGMAAALCYNGKNLDAARNRAMGSGHESVSEHCTFSFLVEDVSRVLLAQLTRHRLASYSVQSQRYCGVEPEWIVPPKIKERGFELTYLKRCNECYDTFCDMVKCGVPDEDARYVIPQGVQCRLMLTMNVRELRHFFSLRCCERAQWEIRDLANRMLALCAEKASALFWDAGPGCVRGHCPEGTKSCGNPKPRAGVSK